MRHGHSRMAGDGRGIVVFGGTFDPPHLGHLILACDAYEALTPERFLIIPTGHTPLRSQAGITPAAIRLRMVRAALAGHSHFEVNDMEVVRSGPSYTVDTLRALAASDPRPITLLVGKDAFASFSDWREHEEISRIARIAVMERGEARSLRRVTTGADGMERVTTRRIDISSTEIRDRVAQGRPVRALLPEGVVQIIEQEGLYLRGGSSSKASSEVVAPRQSLQTP